MFLSLFSIVVSSSLLNSSSVSTYLHCVQISFSCSVVVLLCFSYSLLNYLLSLLFPQFLYLTLFVFNLCLFPRFWCTRISLALLPLLILPTVALSCSRISLSILLYFPFILFLFFFLTLFLSLPSLPRRS